MMQPFYMSFVKDGAFAGACLVYASDAKSAMQTAWEQKCNPGGEIQMLNPKFIPDDKWFNRLLSISDLREMEAELNQKYHQDKPLLTPRLYQ